MSILGVVLLFVTAADTGSARGSISRLDVSALPRAQIILTMPLGAGRWVARPRASDFSVSTEGGRAPVNKVAFAGIPQRSDVLVLEPTAPIDRVRGALGAIRTALEGRTASGDQLTIVGWDDSLPVVVGPGAPASVLARVLNSLPDSTVATPAMVVARAKRMWDARPPRPGNVLVLLPRGAVPQRALKGLAASVVARPGSALIVGDGPRGVQRTVVLAVDGGADLVTAARLWAIMLVSADSVPIQLEVQLPAAPEGAEQHVSVALASPFDSSATPLLASYLSLAPGRFSLAGGELPRQAVPWAIIFAVGGAVLLLAAAGAGFYWSRRARDDA